MPIYEYECLNCGHYFELIQKINDVAGGTCPNCQKEQIERLVSAPGFQLKGTGWYVTDFRDKKPQNTNAEKTKPSTEKGTKTE